MTDVERPPPKPLVTGVASALSPMVRRVLAPNPGVMTGPGTNTYLVGIDEVAVIDPAVDDQAHIDAIVGCGGDRIRWILCTHTHPDHFPGAAPLKERTGAEVLAFASRDGLESWLRSNPRCTVFQGHARFEAPDVIRVGDDADRLSAPRIFINVGGRAAVPLSLIHI